MKTNRLSIIIGLLVGISLVLSARPRPGVPAMVKVAVVSSHNAEPFEKTLEAFLGHLKKNGLEYTFDVYLMEGEANRGNQIAKELQRKKPTVIFTIGSIATYAVLDRIANIPVISGLVLRGDEFRGKKNATGVSLQFSPETQLSWVKRMLPATKSVGVIYNPEENQKMIDESIAAAKKMGMTLVARKVNSPKDLPYALENLERRADVFLSVPDRIVLNPKTAKHILLYCFRNKIPFVGLSSAWVKAGALYSLDCDYRDIGLQCAEMALKIVRGAPVQSVKHALPRKVTYSLNMKTAEILKVDFPESIRKGAAMIFSGGN